jgi:hypothetical protein
VLLPGTGALKRLRKALFPRDLDNNNVSQTFPYCPWLASIIDAKWRSAAAPPISRAVSSAGSAAPFLALWRPPRIPLDPMLQSHVHNLTSAAVPLMEKHHAFFIMQWQEQKKTSYGGARWNFVLRQHG